MSDLTQNMVETMLKGNEKQEARSETAKHLIKNYYFATFRDTEEIYHYREGYYNNGGDRYIREYVRVLWGNACTTQDINEIKKAHIMPLTYIDRKDFNADINTICLENGILNLQTIELEEHNPEHKFTFQLPINWNPDAVCPQIDEFLHTTLDPDDIPIFWQLAGYCLWRNYPIHKAFMLTGDGSNGKSTLINLMKAYLGEENICSKSLHSIVYDKFSSAVLYGKHANLYADLSDQALKQTGMFKLLTGADSVDGEKKFKDSFTFKNYAKFIFSANKLPEVYDTTSAFFRRWIIINFPNTFDDDTADKNLIEKLTTPEELSGMLCKAVKALQTLLADGKFHNSKTTDEIEDRYIKLSNSVAAFVKDVLTEDNEAKPIGRGQLYSVYTNYCRTNDLIIKSQTMFTRTLKEFISVSESRHGNERVWKGISVKNELYQSSEDKYGDIGG